MGKLPLRLLDQGFTAEEAGRYSYWVMVGFALLLAVLVRLTWRAGRVASTQTRQPVLKCMREGLADAWHNPRIALAYLTAYASRGDFVVVGTFLSLWIVHAGRDAGLTSGAGLARAGIMVAIVQGTAMLWAPVMGMIADRINRVAAAMVGFGLAAIGYLYAASTTDPFAASAIVACIGLGIGEISGVIAGSALLGQEAPIARRGSVVGLFGLTGAFSILATTYIGGVIFDAIGPTAPFAMMGYVNLFVAALALLVLWRAPGLSAAEVRSGH